MSDTKTAIITGAQQGIGAGLVEAFLKAGYNVVATSRNVSESFTASRSLILIDGDIGKEETAAKCVGAAIERFGTINVLVNNAGIFYTKPLRNSLPKISMPWSRPTCWDSSISRNSRSNRC